MEEDKVVKPERFPRGENIEITLEEKEALINGTTNLKTLIALDKYKKFKGLISYIEKIFETIYHEEKEDTLDKDQYLGELHLGVIESIILDIYMDHYREGLI